MGGIIGPQTNVTIYNTYVKSEVDGKLRLAVRNTLNHAANVAGLTLVNGSFETGASVTTATQVVWFEAEGSFYSWGGTFPVTVAVGSTPATTGGISSTGWINQWEGVRRIATDTRFLSSGYVLLPAGPTSTRPTNPVNGMMRYNTDMAAFEGYVNGQWGGVGGANANGAIYENSQLINISYTITAGKNGFSAGPISISDGIVVGIPNGSTWVIA